jgi:hypothetical protein
LSLAGQSLAFLEGNLEEGATLIDRALALNPNLAEAWHYSSWVTSFRDHPVDHGPDGAGSLYAWEFEKGTRAGENRCK